MSILINGLDLNLAEKLIFEEIKVKTLKQTTQHILMVRPANFGFNEQTAGNNAFQTKDNSQSSSEIQALAVQEFDQMVNKLIDHGVEVMVFEDSKEPLKPDAIFPNNWITTHPSGVLITYPMYAPVRRLERSTTLVESLKEKFEVQASFDFSGYEEQDLFLEGTGSMVLDRVNKLVYACLSPRTDAGLLERFCKLTGYKKVVFRAVDEKNQDIYHTNVMMAMGENFVVICQATIKDSREAAILAHHFETTEKEVITITMDQMHAFAGNMLQVANSSGETFLVMSERAYQSLTDQQIRQIESHTNILYSPIPTIEKYGGGSVRCMMAELFLKKK